MSNDWDDVTPSQVIRKTFRWVPVTVILIIAAVGLFTGLYVTVFAHAGNAIDRANQQNQLKHDQRQSAIINQQDKNIYGSIGYQDAQVAAMEQNLGNITGPSGLEITRASLAPGDPEQQVLQASELDQVRSFCTEGAKVAPDNPQFNSGTPSLKQIYAANCTAGSPDASPLLARNPVPDDGA